MQDLSAAPSVDWYGVHPDRYGAHPFSLQPAQEPSRSDEAAGRLPPPMFPSGSRIETGRSPRPEEAQIARAAAGDAHVAELIRLVKKLSDSLLSRGEAGLRATPDMTPFETTLRAYCVGFLASARTVDRPRPEV